MEGLLGRLEKELKLRNYSKKTIKGYISSVKHFLKYAEGKGLNGGTLQEYILKNLERQSPSSVARASFAIKFFFEKVLDIKINLQPIKRNKSLPDILTIKEMKRLIENTSNTKHKLIIKLLYGCGFRVSEIINLMRGDIDFEEELIKVKIATEKVEIFFLTRRK